MQTTTSMINGVDTDALKQVMSDVEADRAKGMVGFEVTSAWQGGTRSDAHVKGFTIGGEHVAREFTMKLDEPEELLGGDTHANPQEYLFAALNGCMIVGYATAATMAGITLSKLEIETSGELDLAGFLGLDPHTKPGYDEVRYTVRIAGDATPEQFEELHRTVMSHSVNRYNFANPIRMVPELVVEG